MAYTFQLQYLKILKLQGICHLGLHWQRSNMADFLFHYTWARIQSFFFAKTSIGIDAFTMLKANHATQFGCTFKCETKVDQVEMCQMSSSLSIPANCYLQELINFVYFNNISINSTSCQVQDYTRKMPLMFATIGKITLTIDEQSILQNIFSKRQQFCICSCHAL